MKKSQDTKHNILYDAIYMKSPEKAKLKTDNRLGVA